MESKNRICVLNNDVLMKYEYYMTNRSLHMITCFAVILNNLINYKGADIFRSCIIINGIILRQYNIKSFDQSIEQFNI